MSRSLSVRISAFVLIAAMAMPVMAAPRDDSPLDGFERAISRVMSRIQHVICNLADTMLPPK